MRLHLFPWIGERPIDAVTPKELLETLRRIEAKGHLETAHRVLELAGQVFKTMPFRLGERPSTLPLKGALPPAVTKHRAAITDPQTIGRLLLDIDHYQGSFITLFCALKLSPLVFLRPGELCRLQWVQVDLERAEIRLPIEHMKRRQTEKEAGRGESVHTESLAWQALALLADLRRLTDDTPFLFPHRASSERQTKTMSDATVC